MPRNKIGDLRNHLFETIEALKDLEQPMDIARAKAIADVAQVVINSGKLELRAMEICGQQLRSDFIGPLLEAGPSTPERTER
jgi:hypothetical protein